MKERVVQREKTDFKGFFRSLWEADLEVNNDNDNEESNKVISKSANMSQEEKEELLKSLNKFIKMERNYANSIKGHNKTSDKSKRVVGKVNVNVDKSIGEENLNTKSYKTYDSNSIDKTR